MNQPNQRMLGQLLAAVEAQRKAFDEIDDLKADISSNGLNEQQVEDLEEFVADLALDLDIANGKPVGMPTLQRLLRILETCQP